MTVAISLSAYVMIACLFVPKLYIIVFHPERNVRQSMKPTTMRQSTMASNTGGTTVNAVNTTGATVAVPAIQMTALKQNHTEKPSPVMVDSATQAEGEKSVFF